MTYIRDKISKANTSYLMDVARRKRLEETTSSNYSRSFSEENDEADAIAKWKEKRLAKLKDILNKRREYMDKGNGSLEVLTDEKDVINIANSNPRVVCHFYQEGFQRCKIIDNILTALARQFLDTKFVKILASKAPFFTEKLHIKILPTLVSMIDGKISHVYIGFQEFNGDDINLNAVRNMLFKHKVLTYECCTIDESCNDNEHVSSDPDV
ncbi:conserved hypothetical protein [Theileria equi strain WA]|uniref:Phosducin domain-containing protein n=1 Tax=Theileria equi strain WA TaxID=1537102 RepID=L1LCT2_THEEQ|nr:conserved hypothetical protein [Theileria equi strain WA]EKX73089.1 conserved hypothetical protein [Theileria equi strain WA]|eukprot:XP_004832541.1 conserved hypothetical protein [Theileria equi strain WA]